MRSRKKRRMVWVLAPLGLLAPLWRHAEGPAALFPVLQEVSPQLVGICGWALVGLGFFAVALTALLGPRARERKPSFWPFRPQGMFFLPVHHRNKKH